MAQNCRSKTSVSVFCPRVIVAAALCFTSLLTLTTGPVRAAPTATTWYVTTVSDDVSDGDLATQSGSLRFTLANASSGDLVSFTHLDTVVDTIDVFSTLFVPAGVAVGHPRNGDCGSATSPLITIRADSPITMVFMLGAGSSLHGLDIGNGTVSAKVTGGDVDICGVGLGYLHDATEGLIPAPPQTAALIVDGPSAILRRSNVNGAMIIGSHGSDTRIGDAIGGNGDGNEGACGNAGKCAITILADPLGGPAAQRVTIRDPFPRALNGLVGYGIPGGDDVLTHTNNWAETPLILSVVSTDQFASVAVTGTASALSLVDIYFDNSISVTRQTSVMADVTGNFTFNGLLQGAPVLVFAVSTLDNSNYSNRVGSSSQLSNVALVAGSPFPPVLWIPIVTR